MALSKATRDHEEIRRWAEARGAVPAEVSKTHTGDEPGILRFCFPDAPNQKDANLREISWEEFFEKFDENNLELVYQEKTAEGEVSNFNKLVHPESVEERSRGRSGSRNGGARSSGSRSSASKNTGSRSSAKKSSGTRSASSAKSGGAGSRSAKKSSSSKGSASSSSRNRSSHAKSVKSSKSSRSKAA